MIRKADDTHTSTDFHFRKVADKDGVGGQASQGTRTVEYFYKDWQVLEERDDSDNLQRQYVYGRYIDEPLTLDDRGDGQTVADLNDGSGDDRVFYHCNTQYSTHALTDETGSIVEAYQYDAYGRPTVFTDSGSDGTWFTDADTQQMEGESSVANKYFFQGRRFDEETQMQYFRNRYYNSRLGRFISRDPMGVWYDQLEFGNAYASFYSTPINYGDFLGLKVWAIDGTATDWEDNSNVRKFYERVNESKSYWEGPNEGLTGFDSHAIASAIKDDICDDVCSTKNYTINLVGWSRGAIIALEVAEQLKEGCCCCCWHWTGLACEDRWYKGVNWVGLFDAVEMMPYPGWTNKVKNTSRASHAMKSGNWASSSSAIPFPTIELSSGEHSNVNEAIFYEGSQGLRTYHGDIGMSNELALEWMVNEAKSAGVNIE